MNMMWLMYEDDEYECEWNVGDAYEYYIVQVMLACFEIHNYLVAGNIIVQLS